MKKINLKSGSMLVAVFSLIFLLSGCGGKNEKNNPSAEKNQEQTQAQESKEIQQQNGNGRGNMPSGMTEICKDKAEGDSCEFSLPNRDGEDGENKTVAGNCKKNQTNENLFCASENMPEGRGQNGQGKNNQPSVQE